MRRHSHEWQVSAEVLKHLRSVRRDDPKFNRQTELLGALAAGLELQEALRVESAAPEELVAWTARAKRCIPPGGSFTGRAVHFAYADAKRIRKQLMSAGRYDELEGDGLEYVCAVRCFGFFGGVFSVWAYFGVVDTNLAS